MQALAFLLVLATQDLAPAPATPYDRVIPLELDASDALLAGRGRLERVQYVAEFSGTLHLWTRVEGELDLCLRVEDANGALLAEDDASGGCTTPYVKLELEPGRELVVLVAAFRTDALGSLELCAMAAPETPATRAVSEAALGAISEVNRLREAGELEAGRELAIDTLDALAAVAGCEASELVCARFRELGHGTYLLSLPKPTEKAWRHAHRHRSRTLPDEHIDLQAARLNLAVTIKQLGDLQGARALFEQVLEVFSDTLPDDHADLQKARANLAVAIRELGDLQGARALEEQVLEVRSRTLPDEHRDLQAARLNLAVTIKELGDLHGARALEERVLEVYSRTLPEEHPELQTARLNFAMTIKQLGDLHGARALEEQVLEVYSRTLPEEHPELQTARLNFAGTIMQLGDLQGAQVLFEQVLEVRSRTLPDEHPALQMARGNLAATIKELGDLQGARALQERVLEVFSSTLPEEHPYLQAARLNLAATIKELGDLQGARALEEQALEVNSRTLPDDHPALQGARLNLAGTIKALGDLDGARALEEQVVEVFSSTLPDEHSDLQVARLNLAITIRELGDLQGARALIEQVLEVYSRTLPEEHPALQTVRLSLVVTIRELGDLQGARALIEQVLEVYSHTLPDEHPHLQSARLTLAETLVAQSARAPRGMQAGEADAEATEGAREKLAGLVTEVCSSQVQAARQAVLSGSVREAEERCARIAEYFDGALSFAEGYGVLAPLADRTSALFALSEATRGAGLAVAGLMRSAAGHADYDRLREELRGASQELAGLAQQGTTREEYHRLRRRSEELEQQLVARARELTGGAAVLDGDLAALRSRLGEGGAAVAYRRYVRHSRITPADGRTTGNQAADAPGAERMSVESLCAFVVRQGGAGATLTLVQLGPIDAVEQAARAWRVALGVRLERGVGMVDATASLERSRGEALRTLVWDPLLAHLGDAQRVVVVPDDVLHLVPLDALPLSSADGARHELLGERWRIETRVTLTELLGERPAAQPGGALVALGGAAFNSEPLELEAAELAVLEQELAGGRLVAGILRGGAWERGFAPLTYTGLEAREVAALHAEVFEDAGGALVLEKRKASRRAVEELAPRARWLHVATHGWFAPESIPSWTDSQAFDAQTGMAAPFSGEETVRGMSPMLLCGLALSGANLPEDALGRPSGLVTAEELATFDLSGCELAVLSACDTNVGERRAGQGVASLQKALQMAGARSALTSLWKVPDEATRELMLDFYRRLWVEQKPKHQALWEAKLRLRDERDERGEPRYTTRDWAGWVLTGNPD